MTEQHSDLIVLAGILLSSGQQVQLAPWMRPKDINRLGFALAGTPIASGEVQQT